VCERMARRLFVEGITAVVLKDFDTGDCAIRIDARVWMFHPIVEPWVRSKEAPASEAVDMY